MLVLLGLVFLGAPAHKKPLPPDFVAYVEAVRAAGASESAQGDLKMVASILTGERVLEFPKDDDGDYTGESYRSKACPPPGLTPDQLDRWYDEKSKKLDPILAKLEELADADHSGFVTNPEAGDLRRAFIVGEKVAFLAEKETSDPHRLQELVRLEGTKFWTPLARYDSLVKALDGTPGISIRPLPPGLVRSLAERR
jgi:hypothetical protein